TYFFSRFFYFKYGFEQVLPILLHFTGGFEVFKMPDMLDNLSLKSIVVPCQFSRGPFGVLINNFIEKIGQPASQADQNGKLPVHGKGESHINHNQKALLKGFKIGAECTSHATYFSGHRILNSPGIGKHKTLKAHAV